MTDDEVLAKTTFLATMMATKGAPPSMMRKFANDWDMAFAFVKLEQAEAVERERPPPVVRPGRNDRRIRQPQDFAS